MSRTGSNVFEGGTRSDGIRVAIMLAVVEGHRRIRIVRGLENG